MVAAQGRVAGRTCRVRDNRQQPLVSDATGGVDEREQRRSRFHTRGGVDGKERAEVTRRYVLPELTQDGEDAPHRLAVFFRNAIPIAPDRLPS